MKTGKLPCFGDILPKSDLIVGYGSGIYPQDGSTRESFALLDLLVFCDDRMAFVEHMMKMGYISRASLLASRILNPEVAFFTDLRTPSGVGFKVGVIESRRALSRLRNWQNSYYIPGRLQKPVKILYRSSESIYDSFQSSLEVNLINGLRAAVISLPHDHAEGFNLEQLFTGLVRLSYIGDIRIAFAENPHKVQNIVKAQSALLTEMYSPYFNAVGVTEVSPGVFKSTKEPLELWKSLPPSFTQNSGRLSDPRSSLISRLSRINFRESSYQAFAGVGTSGVSNSLKYLVRKVSKRFR
jgi:hypothetical protein